MTNTITAAKRETQSRTRNLAPALATFLLAISCIMLAAAVFVTFALTNASSVLVFVPTQLAFVVVGALVATKRPENAVGWLLLMFGFLGSFAMLATALSGGVDLSTFGAPQATHLPFLLNNDIVRWAAWVSTIWTELSLLPIMLALLLFPTGRPASRLWAWIAGAVVAVELVGTITTAVSDVNFHNNFTLADPVTLLSPTVMARVYSAYQDAELVLLVLVVASLVDRYRRAGDEQRAQLKWVLWACALLVGSFFLLLVSGVEPVWGFIVCAPLIPAAMGIAIVRYRLFDIDRIISRTTSYAIVSVAVLAVYSVVITSVTLLLPDSSKLSVAAATLLAAAIARPLLRRVQGVVDRRFNRARYNAQHALEQFGAGLRNAVDTDLVRGQLASAVQNTLQPSQIDVWTRESA